MATWIINSASSCVSAEGTDWLDALAASLPHFNLAPGALGQLTCAFQADGSVEVQEPRSRLKLRIAPQDATDALFDRCGRIAGAADTAEAASITLGLVRELVPAEAGAVLLTTPRGSELSFVAAFGPRADRVLGTRISVNSGIAGFITNFQTGTIIHDVRGDCRFHSAVDKASGYITRSMLAVPINTLDGPCYGCLQLINVPEAFQPRDLQVAQTIAGALAAWLLGTEA